MRALLFACVMVMGWPGAGRADVIFSENFDDPAFRGYASDPSDSSDRWAATSYSVINAVHGWSFTGGDYLARNEANTADQALLLNEGGNHASVTLSGLVQGASYTLSFLLSGDNVSGAAYSGYVAVNGASILAFAGVDGRAGTNPGITDTASFVVAGTSATLSFFETSRTAASPIIDDIVVTGVPEPASLALLGAGLVGVGVVRRGRAALLDRAARAGNLI